MRLLLFFIFALGIAHATDNHPNALSDDLQRVLDNADSAEIYSLDPNGDPRKEPALHGVSILGHTQLSKAETHETVKTFNDAVKGWDHVSAECFNPRHALRIRVNGRNYDYLLCYECHQIEVYLDNILMADIGAAGSPDALNAILRAHRLPLARNN